MFFELIIELVKTRLMLLVCLIKLGHFFEALDLYQKWTGIPRKYAIYEMDIIAQELEMWDM